MRNLTTRIAVALITFIVGITLATFRVLWNPQPTSKVSEQAIAQATPSAAPLAKAAPTSNSPIRSIDFSNFAFPKYPIYDRERERYVTLKPGERMPFYTAYGDITGDGEEEAMLALGVESGGSAIPHVIYVYGIQGKRLKLLWRFEDGDRADGGLRRIYAENGGLVVELYGKRTDGTGKIVGSDLFAEDGMMGGDCCPSHFTRARYKWNGKRFVLRDEPEVLPNPEKHGSPILPD